MRHESDFYVNSRDALPLKHAGSCQGGTEDAEAPAACQTCVASAAAAAQVRIPPKEGEQVNRAEKLLISIEKSLKNIHNKPARRICRPVNSVRCHYELKAEATK